MTSAATARTSARSRARLGRKQTLALHLFLQRLQGLVDVVIANENLHACSFVIDPRVTVKAPKTGALSRAALAEKALRVHSGNPSTSGSVRNTEF